MATRSDVRTYSLHCWVADLSSLLCLILPTSVMYTSGRSDQLRQLISQKDCSPLLWSLRIEDIFNLLVFSHMCLQSIARVLRVNWVSNVEVRCRTLVQDNKLVDEIVNLHRLRWLWHVLYMSGHCLSRPVISGVRVRWKKGKDGQTKT